MYLHRSLEIRALTPDQIMNLAKDRFEPTVIIDKEKDKVVVYANIYADESEEDSSGW